MGEEEVSIRLSINEFVVLDEFLRRYSTTGNLTIEDEAERQALWALQCIFEREPSRSDSWPTVADAWKTLRRSED